MIKKLYLPLVALLVLALSSCGKMGELSSDYFTTNPEVLEAIGGKAVSYTHLRAHETDQ